MNFSKSLNQPNSRRSFLKSLVVLSLAGNTSDAISQKLSIDPSRPLGSPGYRNWVDPTGTGGVQDRKKESSGGFNNVGEIIKHQVSIAIKFIEEQKFMNFTKLPKESLIKTFTAFVSYLWQLRQGDKGIEIVSFLRQFLALGANNGLTEGDTVHALQTLSYLDLLPNNFQLSDGTSIRTDEIFGSRFYRSHDNRKLTEQIKFVLESVKDGKSSKQDLKKLIP